MISTICTICARSGSKGLPDKNIRELAGKPLLAYSIELAIESGAFNAVVVTSDADEYLEVAKSYGADFLVKRPDKLAGDNISKLGAIEHAVSFVEKQQDCKFDEIVDIDVTSPLRTVGDIMGAIALFRKTRVSSVITGSLARRSPYTNLVEADENGIVRVCKPSVDDLSRRQEAPKCYDMNASVYVWQREIFKRKPAVFYNDTLLYEMPLERSWDIDYEIDFRIVEFLMQNT